MKKRQYKTVEQLGTKNITISSLLNEFSKEDLDPEFLETTAGYYRINLEAVLRIEDIEKIMDILDYKQ